MGLGIALVALHVTQERVALPVLTNLGGKGFVLSGQTETLSHYYEPTPNSTEVWDPEWLSVKVANKINADTLNEQKDYTVDKTIATYRIVALGDSFTYGHFVNTDENYTEVLENLLNSLLSCPTITLFDVINLGVPGYDIAYNIERLRMRGIKYNPDLVLWLVNYWNMQTVNEQRLPLQENFMRKGIPVFDAKTRTNDAVLMALDIIKGRIGEEGIRNYQKEALERLKTIYHRDLLLVSFPGMPTKSEAVIAAFVGSNTKYSYWNGLFDYFRMPQYHLFDHHPSANGHARIAREIFEYLAAHQFASCGKTKYQL